MNFRALVIVCGLCLAALAVLMWPPSAPAVDPLTYTYYPVADAKTDANNPGTNYGNSTTFSADASPDIDSYLKFTLFDIPANAQISDARLRITTNSSSSSGITVNAVSDTTWTELGLTHNSPKPTMGTTLASSGEFSVGDRL